MRYVTLVESLNLRKLPMLNNDEVRYHSLEAITPVPGPGEPEFLATDQRIETRVVPIHEFVFPDRGKAAPVNMDELNRQVTARNSVYIAWSQEVQELLEMPFDVLKRQLDEAHVLINCMRADLACYRHAGWWKRLRYLFNRRRP